MTSTGQLENVLYMITQGPRLWKAVSRDIVISACNGRSKNLEGNVGVFCCLCTEVLPVTPLAAYWSELVIRPASKTEPGSARAHPYYFTDEETKALKG